LLRYADPKRLSDGFGRAAIKFAIDSKEAIVSRVGQFKNSGDATAKERITTNAQRIHELRNSLDEDSFNKDNIKEVAFAYNLKANLNVFSKIYVDMRYLSSGPRYITFKETFYYCILDTLFLTLNKVREHIITNLYSTTYNGLLYINVAYAVLAQIESCFWDDSWIIGRYEPDDIFLLRQIKKTLQYTIKYETIIKNTNNYMFDPFDHAALRRLHNKFNWSQESAPLQIIDDDAGPAPVSRRSWRLAHEILNSQEIKNSIYKVVLSYIAYYNFHFITTQDKKTYQNLDAENAFSESFRYDTGNAEPLRHIITELKLKLYTIESTIIDSETGSSYHAREHAFETATFVPGNEQNCATQNRHVRFFNHILRELKLTILPECWAIKTDHSEDFENFASDTINGLVLDRSIIYAAINSYNNAVVISALTFFDKQNDTGYYSHRTPMASATNPGIACEEFNIRDSLSIILIITDILHEMLKSFIKKIRPETYGHEDAALYAVKFFTYFEFKNFLSPPLSITTNTNIINKNLYIQLKEDNRTNEADYPSYRETMTTHL
jgi:hypothetical protein